MIIKPDWPAPKNIHAFTTTRLSGELQVPHEPIWLTQTHSTIAVEATAENLKKEADASFTTNPLQICAVLTADCLPILLCNQSGTCVAAIHAGWRGLANGIIESTLQAIPADTFMAWLGPAIGNQHYEIGDEVRDIFLREVPEAYDAFTPSPQKRWMLDLYAIARIRLHNLGINQVYGGDYCTYSDEKLFHSYRRDGKSAGRMVSLIWIS